jgi:hypothetical protein
MPVISQETSKVKATRLKKQTQSQGASAQSLKPQNPNQTTAPSLNVASRRPQHRSKSNHPTRQTVHHVSSTAESSPNKSPIEESKKATSITTTTTRSIEKTSHQDSIKTLDNTSRLSSSSFTRENPEKHSPSTDTTR